MKTGIVLGLIIPTLLMVTGTPAFADDKAACLDAASKGQRLRDQHKLVEAREQLRVCAAAGCPGVVQTDCAGWLADVEKALPSVVVTAKDGAGADLIDVKVSVDGQPLVSKLDGQAVPMNAGPHTFHFESAAGASVDRQVLVREGAKNQTVAVVLVKVATPVTAAQPPTNAGAEPQQPESPAPSPESSPPSGSAWKTVGFVVGGAGIVGLGLATVFGLVAVNDKNNAHCNSSNVCDPGTTSGIKSAALASDVGWIAGGVLLAGGAGLVLFGPSGTNEAGATARVMPIMTLGGGGLAVGGAW
jgi:hypothetical protein